MAGLPWNNIRLLYNGYGWVIGGEVDAVAASNALVYQPGGAGAGPVVFASWADLMAQLTMLRAGAGAGGGGTYAIAFDNSIVSPVVVPAGGPYDMTGVMWLGSNRTGPVTEVLVDIANGASFLGLRAFAGQLAVTNRNLVNPACPDLASGDYISLETASIDTVAGGAPMFDGAALGAGDSVVVWLDHYSSIGNFDVGPVVNDPVAGTVLLVIQSDGSSIGADAVTGAIGAGLVTATDSYLLTPSFPGWLGTVYEPRDDAAPTFFPRPYLAAPAVGPFAAFANDWLRINAIGGPINQPLPLIAAPDRHNTGGVVIVTETGGGLALTASAQAGNSIDGVPGPGVRAQIDPLCSVMFVSDGVDNWQRVARFSPTVVLSTTTPVRAIGDPFQPSTKYDCLVRYGIETVAGVLGVGAGDGYVQLLCDAANPPTVPRDRSGAAGTAAAVKVYGSIGFLVPRGWWVLLDVPPAINVTHVLVNQVEQLVHP
jgi:hypothetical protein